MTFTNYIYIVKIADIKDKKFLKDSVLKIKVVAHKEEILDWHETLWRNSGRPKESGITYLELKRRGLPRLYPENHLIKLKEK